jgi:Ca2+-binding RTX toxin-like protein
VGNIDGSDPHDVAPSFSDFAWAPDSLRLAYTADAEIFVVNADGTGSTSLGPGRSPAWSPDGGQIAFIGPLGALSVMTGDGTGRRVVFSPGVSGGPSWSPDGNRLAFVVEFSLYISNVDGTQRRSFTGAFLGSPQWSHDGTLVAAGRGAADGVGVVDIQRGVVRWYKGSDPSWSPVTHDLAAVYDGPCIFTGVRLISADRRSSRRLTLDCHIRGTRGDDRIVGTNLPDLIAGLAGNDTLEGEGDSDTIAGGPGADRVLGGDFGDFLNGGPGNDLLAGGAFQQDAYAEQDDVLNGGLGADDLRGGPGWDRLSGDSGNDLLRGGADSDILRGGPGKDRLYARGDPEPGFGDRSGDMVDCGSGRDLAFVDRNDKARNCEVVRRR